MYLYYVSLFALLFSTYSVRGATVVADAAESSQMTYAAAAENAPPPHRRFRRAEHSRPAPDMPREAPPGAGRRARPAHSLRAEFGMRALEWVQEQDEDAFVRLMMLREKDPAAFHEEMRTWMKKYMQEEQPEAYEKMRRYREARREIRDLLAAYHHAETDEERAEVNDALRAHIREGIHAYKEMQLQRIQEMERRLERVKADLEAHTADIDACVEERLEKLHTTYTPSPSE